MIPIRFHTADGLLRLSRQWYGITHDTISVYPARLTHSCFSLSISLILLLISMLGFQWIHSSFDVLGHP
ncbi:hypothetical protein M422DRAFT_266719 [Sphaerobolus stellatus SS14]|uniref:Uncharacterized protein n=1 Tax=Sphaerobolus stellatus (strain SS14) TaxID=990650 RepID=A0A0C9TNI2_SPHS4|nr:hypothetical protein M422DRAFT_266719 [Sphaerobolus stellatus SS14]